MYSRLRAEGASFTLLDPDASVLRDSWPGSGYEPAVTALLSRGLRDPEAVFFDVGALYGYFSVWAAQHQPRATVVAFEPSTQYLDVLRLNLLRNESDRVVVAPVALSDHAGAVSFAARTLPPKPDARSRGYVRGWLNEFRQQAGSTEQVVRAAPDHWRAPLRPWIAAVVAERFGMFTAGADQQNRTIEAISADQWIAEHGVGPTVVKIDVHGAELLVLRGMRNALRSTVTNIVVEVHTDDLLVTGTHQDIVAELEEAGLKVFELRGFRRRRGELVPLVGEARADFCDQRRWRARDLYFMRCLYARRPESRAVRP